MRAMVWVRVHMCVHVCMFLCVCVYYGVSPSVVQCMCGWAALPALAFNEWKSQHKPTKIHTHTQCCSKKEVNEHTEKRQRKKRSSQRYIALLEWMRLWMNGQPDFQLRIKYTCRIFWWPQVSPLKSYSTCHLSVYFYLYVCVGECISNGAALAARWRLDRLLSRMRYTTWHLYLLRIGNYIIKLSLQFSI